MGPIKVLGRKKSEGGGVFASDDLFERGLEAFKKGKMKAALKAFALILEHFPRSPNASPAIHNMGLCYEKLGQFTLAAKLYRRYLKKELKIKDRVEALFRLASVDHRSKRFFDAAETLKKLASMEGVSPKNQIEADLRRGKALLALGRVGEAEKVFRATRRLFELHRKGDKPLGPDQGGRIAYQQAKVYHERMKRVVLKLPVEIMTQKIAKKGRLFKKAKKRYFLVLKEDRPVWSAAALRGVISLLEDFVWSVVRAPVPPFHRVRFYDEERKSWKVIPRKKLRRAYVSKLKRKLQLVLMGAIKSFRRNRTLTRGLKLKVFWREEAPQLLSRLRGLLEAMQNMRLGRRTKKGKNQKKPKDYKLFRWGVVPNPKKKYRPFLLSL